MEEIKKKNKKLKTRAIILLIIIITVSIINVYSFNWSKGNISIQPNIKEMEKRAIEIFNSRFNSYVEILKGTVVKVILEEVMESNQFYQYDDSKIVNIEIKDGSLSEPELILDFISKIEEKNLYNVNPYDSDENGYIDKIFIRAEGEEKSEEELKLEQIQQEKDQTEYETEYDRWLKEQAKLEKEEKMTKIVIIVISILAIIGIILIIKGFIILKKGDENKKHKVLIAFISIEVILVIICLVLFQHTRILCSEKLNVDKNILEA